MMTNKTVISSGHAKYVRGASCYIDEVDEARKAVDQVAEYLNELGCTVYKFHDDTSKTQRDNINAIVKYHNSKERDLDVSVHFNAASKTDNPRGVEVLYYSDSNKKLAENMSQAISKASGLKNRGAKKRTGLGFLKGTSKPAILIEICFVDSVTDVNIYEDKFDEICRVIAETISGKMLAVVKKASTKKYHTVVKGDTVSAIAREYDTTIAKIKSWNKLDSKYTIWIGQKLRVE
ncbi:N-acetylmuramoyl-L-alanine amidase [Peribacillus asahii]|uniref:N-acetylmuramoyl-L-alanine amidase n=1 Tax=Peribacillus asahii TaxID=228899 RepID=UPI00207A29FE|nr:N-acetylmuramoyl-L-alanine amidase [Peribacillus asahii]USK71780.1 N-acetylmuramoyl-L-alanine amidase [Peribacillus asahii]